MRSILLTVLLFAGSSLSAQNEFWKSEPATMEEGVPHHLVYTMLQDHKGFLWFGTMYGLYRFDGRFYTVFRHDPADTNSPSSDDVVHLHEDREGVLWIATYAGGVNSWNPRESRFQSWTHRPGDPNSLADNRVSCVATDSSGRVWIGTDIGLDELDPRTGLIIHHGRLSSSGVFPDSVNIRRVLVDTRQRVWVATMTSGLYCLDLVTRSWNHYLRDPNGRWDFRQPINAVVEDSHGTVWIGARSGLFQMSSAGPLRVGPDSLQRITALHYGRRLWIGAVGGTYRLNDDRTVTSLPSSWTISRRFVPDLLEDHTGNLWVSVYEAGTEKIAALSTNDPAGRPDPFVNIVPEGPRRISALAIRNGIVAMATDEGLLIQRGSTTRVVLWPSRINALLADDDMFWVGTMTGLRRYDPVNDVMSDVVPGEQIHSAIRINTLWKDRRGVLWAGSDDGIYVHDAARNLLTRFRANGSMRPGFVISMYEDQYHELWVGTYDGTFCLDSARQSWRTYVPGRHDPHSVTNPYALSFHEDRQGRLWIGTAGGLDRWDRPTGRFIHTEADLVLASGVISSILEDSTGRFWIGTNSGLYRFDPNRESVTAYDRMDGLPHNMFVPNISAMEGDRLYFGTYGGLVRVNPHALPSDSAPPKLVLTFFRSWLDSKELLEFGVPDRVELEHRQNFFSINFAVIDFVRPGKTRFAWKLEGLDPGFVGWSDRHEAMYTDVPPGHYRFVAKATNRDGRWGPETVLMTIVIHPPFWQTWWFRSLVALLLLGAAYAVYRRRLLVRLRHAAELDRARTQERERIRMKTASDFHDELGHRLTRIGLFSEVAKHRIDQPKAELVGYLDKIIDDAQNLTSETRDFIWSLDPRQDSVYDFVNHLTEFGEELFDRTGIQFEPPALQNALVDWSITMDVRRHLTLIIKEGMNNALRHAGASRVVLTVGLEHQTLRIQLSDDGRGFHFKEASPGHGLANMRQRAVLAGAAWHLNSTPNQGTRIEVVVRLTGRLHESTPQARPS